MHVWSSALLLTGSPVRSGTLVGGIRQALRVLLALRHSVIRQSAQVVRALPSGTGTLHIGLQIVCVCPEGRVARGGLPKRTVGGGQIAGGNVARANVDVARVGAVEVGGARRVVGKGEVCLTLGDDVGLVFARFVEDGLGRRQYFSIGPETTL